MNSKKPFKIHLYQLNKAQQSKPLAEVLSAITDDTLEDRIRSGSSPIRLDDIRPPTASEPYWLLDFTKIRYEGGPGRAKKGTPVESFEMAGGYGFSEETAALYDPVSAKVVLQYNHHGPRATTVAEYLSTYDRDNVNDYELLLQLNAGAQARLDKQKIFTRLKVKVAPAKVTKEFRKKNVSVLSALESQINTFGGDVVSIEVGLEPYSNGSLRLKKWIGFFKRMANSEIDAVKALTISGREEVGFPIDPVDLIQERLQTTIRGMPLDDGLRYPRDERYKALHRAWNGWKTQGML